MKTTWGKLKSLALAGTKRWRDHDTVETWDSSEPIEQALAPVDDLRAHLKLSLTDMVSHEIKLAVYEHARDGVWGMGVGSEGRLLVIFDVGNEVAPLYVQVGLAELINATLKEAFANPASADNQAVISAIRSFIRNLAALEGQMVGRQPARAAQPVSGAVIGDPGQSRPRPRASGGKVITRNLPQDVAEQLTQ